MSKFAAIDIGTNAVRLLIGDISSDKDQEFVKKISYTRLPLRLGEEVFMIGKISDSKAEAFVKAMKAFALIADIFKVDDLRACATSAMRDAKNGEEIIQKVKKEVGINIEIISGDEEARLIFGAFQMLKIEKKSHYLVIDVGGGSTEITIFENGIKIAARSFDIGTVRMLKGKVKDSNWDAIKSWLKENVSNNPHDVYGTGGNINKIHKLFGLTDDEEVSLSEMVDFADKLKALSLEDRMKKYKLKADRADVIVPALDIYIYCLNCLKVNEIAVPKMGLSDGMIYDMYLKSF